MALLSPYGWSLVGALAGMSPAALGEEVVRLLEEIHSYRRVVITDPRALDLVRGIHESLRRVDLDVAETTLRAWLDGSSSDPGNARAWLMATVLYGTSGRSLPAPLVERVADVTREAEDDGWRFVRWFPKRRAHLEDIAVVVERVERACAEIGSCAEPDRRAEGAVRLFERITTAFAGGEVHPKGLLVRQLGPAIAPSMLGMFEAMIATPDTPRAIRLVALVGSDWGLVFPAIAPRFGELVRSPADATTVLAACPESRTAAPARFVLAERADQPETMAGCIAKDASPALHVRVAESFVRAGHLGRAVDYLESLPPSVPRDARLRRLLVDAGRPHDALALYVLRPEDVNPVAEALGLERDVVIAHGTKHATDDAAWKRFAAQRGALSPDELLRGHFEPRDFRATLRANASASPRWIGKLCARALDLVFDHRSTWGPNDDPREVLRAIFDAAEAADPERATATRTRLAAKLRKHVERTSSFLLREAGFDALDTLEA